MPIKVICPSCGRSGRVPESSAGRDAMCPACGACFRVPEAPAPPPAPRAVPAPKPISPPPAAPTVPPTSGVPTWMYAALAGGGGTLVVMASIIASLLSRRGGDEPPQVVAPAAVVRQDEPPATPPTTIPVAAPAARAEEGAGAGPPVVVAEPAPPPVAEGKALSTAEIVARCEPAIALVRGKVSSGTGFLIRPGVLATNAHVIDDELIGNLEIRFPSAAEGKRGPYPAELLFEDKARDLAFLSVRTGLYPLALARQFRYAKGEDVVVIGNPGVGGGEMILENAVSRGVLSVKAKIDGQDFYQLGIAINPGNSGGPVLDARGQVIGVATLKSSKEEALGFCIPLEDLSAALDRLASQPPRAALEAQARHRMPLTYKLLATAGALYALALDAHRQAWEQGALQTRGKELSDQRTTLAKLDSTLFANLDAEAGKVEQDASYPEPVRRGIARMSAGYGEMKGLLGLVPGGSLDQFRTRFSRLKQAHRGLVQELGQSLKVPVPEKLLAALSDNGPPGAIASLQEGPDGLSGLRDRFGIGPRFIVPPPIPRHVPPSLRPGIGPRSYRSRFGR
jgi:S1-C subfamily serine protease